MVYWRISVKRPKLEYDNAVTQVGPQKMDICFSLGGRRGVRGRDFKQSILEGIPKSYVELREMGYIEENAHHLARGTRR